MTTDVSQRSAQIIRFPVGGRRALAVRREETHTAIETKLPRASASAIGGAWYHEAAIQESKRAGER